MNTDLSVAPEIALLAAPIVPAQTDVPRPRTDGRLAGDLADLAAAPQRWWDLVRFDAGGPLRIPVPGAPKGRDPDLTTLGDYGVMSRMPAHRMSRQAPPCCRLSSCCR